MLREIFEIDDSVSTLQSEWDLARERVNKALSKVEGEKLKGLVIFTNTEDKMTVSGAGSSSV